MKPTVVFFATLATVVVLALWRGAPYPLWALLHVVLWYSLRLHFQAGDFAPVEETRDIGRENIAISLYGFASFMLPFLTFATPLFDFAAYSLAPLQLWTGLAVGAFSIWLFWRSHVDLGGNWSYLLELRQGHQLVTHGLYARIRHPMYAAFLLFGLTQALLINNWIAGPSGLISIAILFGPRMRNEEAMMRDRFGADYTAYCVRTPRLIPRPRFLTKTPTKGV